ncbi:hypothetical protein [uncultured Methanobrevibacter sp.]|uniref:hypothetical protein n=1 Tax=uncultured Methanobrevibacter sp. TaxID=253161 RepID=UPI0025ECD2C2|nr:hypothetical protein [uncultured Methanobrevibacter sp.]
MKFIGTSWSPNMISLSQWDMICHKLTEEEFKFLSHNAISCINNEALARILNVDYNVEHIALRPGDTLLVAHIKGGHLPDGAKELPRNVVLEFYCYQIMESSAPLIREEIAMEE